MWGEFRRFRGFDNYCGPPIDRADQGTIIALPDRGYFENSSHLSPVFESPFSPPRLRMLPLASCEEYPDPALSERG